MFNHSCPKFHVSNIVFCVATYFPLYQTPENAPKKIIIIIIIIPLKQTEHN